jgi:hypothetical protein
MTERNHETAQTLWEAAFAYAIAVDKLTSREVDPHASDISLPCFMLSGFALELAGKAYLRHVGNSSKTGHDIKLLFDLAAGEGLVVPRLITEGIIALAPWHLDHSFRYVTPNFIAVLPNLAIWPSTLRAFVRGVAIQMAGSEAAVVDWLHE